MPQGQQGHQGSLTGGAGLLLALRFVLELALLAGSAVLAWRLTDGIWQWLAAIAAPAAIAVFWGRFLSPRATVNLSAGARLALETILFAGVAAGLALSGFPVIAAIGFGLWAADRAALELVGR